MKAVSVENVSKRFTLSHTRPRNLADGLRGFLRRNSREAFWALKDVSFAVEQGQAIGMIGHNGAGKSTMLKLLTGIMEPTEGRIRTRGRVSALIEIGAGFHPEMTGRENIYLNGSILGMSRREIDKKFDAIVAFAELDRFIDTPVKRYSSGMYARLGFSVAAHVDPEILLVDEVLSVGDERFQVKCQEHMSRLMKSGVTVVFVSHQMAAVTALCPRALVIHQGKLVFDGDSVEAVRIYRRLQSAPVSEQTSQEASLAPARIAGVRILDENDAESDEIACGSMLTIEATGEAAHDMEGLNFGIEIARADGVRCYDVNSRMDGRFFDVKKGRFTVRFEVPQCNLVDGVYTVSVGIMDRDERIHYHTWKNCAFFGVRDQQPYRGIARLGHEWTLR